MPPNAMPEGENGVKSILRITVNGRLREDAVAESALLLDYLRDTAGLTGTKQGCDGGECGACTVLLDGDPIYACLVLAVEADGAGVETVEGLATSEDLQPLQQIYIDQHGFQCGFCASGFLMSASALLRRKKISFTSYPACCQRTIWRK